MVMYKLLALDIDGTLTNSKKEISPVTKKILMSVQQSGIKIALASGRPTFGLLHIAEELELDKYGGFILPFNGGKIVNFQTGEVLYESNFPNEIIPKVYRSTKENHLTILSYDEKQVITEDSENEYVKKEIYIDHCSAKKVVYFPFGLPANIPKCMVVGDPPEVELLEKKMRLQFGEDINVFRSEPYFLELVPKGVDKGASLARLAEHLGITNKEIVACGDGFNDRTMIAYAGLGVAMANAQPIVKEVANFVTKSNDDDGVAYVAEKYLLRDGEV